MSMLIPNKWREPLTMKWSGSEFKQLAVQSCYGKTVYRLELVNGVWPSDDDLITLCDNKFEHLVRCHFGGQVRFLGETTKEVTVWID